MNNHPGRRWKVKRKLALAARLPAAAPTVAVPHRPAPGELLQKALAAV